MGEAEEAARVLAHEAVAALLGLGIEHHGGDGSTVGDHGTAEQLSDGNATVLRLLPLLRHVRDARCLGDLCSLLRVLMMGRWRWSRGASISLATRSATPA